ncbi:MAG: HlyD family efflux transporter periplasmic adaptor subunit [Planctomycetaceae bacterium]|nr:HlyD family efflux transporter periplasmic adaptor subunit [Planctomycetaceae bacterium]
MSVTLRSLSIPLRCLACLAWIGAGTGAALCDDALQVVIERAPFTIRPAASYDIPLKLAAQRTIQIVALADGVVMPFNITLGQSVAARTELLRLDAQMKQLEVDRASAALKAAQQLATTDKAPALVDVAQKELEIAQLRLNQTVTRMPWDGIVYRVHVTEGEYVRAGSPLLTVADPTQLFVDAPVDRATANVGDMVELKVEDVTVQGKLTAITPLSERLDPLRGLFQSVASGRVELDNGQGRFIAGQTVYSPMIPRMPVGEAPTAAISNAEDGGRKVQVIRDGLVRDIPVQLLGQVGEDHVWISGRFSPEDQLILQTSEPLPDGTIVTPRTYSDRNMTPPARKTDNQPQQAPVRTDF